MRLLAGRTAQELKLTDLGADAGVSHNTVRSWLSVLEASFICFRLPAWHANLRKQSIKAPKIHFYDSGLVCHLLGIRRPAELLHHPARGAVFESWVASEIVKVHVHRGLEPRLFHFRDAKGLEVDMVLDGGPVLYLIEAKSGRTVSEDFFTGLRRLGAAETPRLRGRTLAARLVYAGETAEKRTDVTAIPWSRLDAVRWV
jgi:predicted AAA+ superfamily ATPase